VNDLQKRLQELETQLENELIKLGEMKGYLRAKEEFEKKILSCCCSGCIEHNMFLIGEINGEIHSIHGQLEEKTKDPHGEVQSEHIPD
jgi:hypothetical protein